MNPLNPVLKRRRRRSYFLLIVILFLLCSSLYIVFATDTFKIHSVSVQGTKSIDPKQIISLAATNYIWGPVSLSDLPLSVKSVTPIKDYWHRHLTLNIEERQQYALWCASDGSCVWFDEEGIAFNPSPHVEGSLITVIQAENPATLGETVLPPRLLPNFFSILRLLDKLDLPVKEIIVPSLSKEELTVHLATPSLPIYFSLRLDPGFAAEAIQSLRDKLNQLEYIDLRSANRVFFRYK